MAKALYLTIIFLAIYLLVDNIYSPTYGKLGTIDLIQYHSALDLALDNKNPYDPTLMIQAQRERGYGQKLPIMMWNPPWLLTILYPVIFWDFQTSTKLWLSVQLLSIAVFPLLLMGNVKGNNAYLYKILLCILLFTVPLSLNIYFGQLGPVLMTGAYLLLLGTRRGSLLFTGLGFTLLSVKPHLILLLVLWYLLSRPLSHSLKVLIYTSVTILGLSIFPLVLNTQVHWQWLNAIVVPPEGVFERSFWITQTIGSLIRLVLFHYNVQIDSAINYLPLALAIAVLLILHIKKSSLTVSNYKNFVIIFCISILVTPYGWVYDQVLLSIFIFHLSLNQTALSKRSLIYCSIIALAISYLLWWSHLIVLFIFLYPSICLYLMIIQNKTNFLLNKSGIPV